MSLLGGAAVQEIVTVVWSSQLAECRDAEFELVDDFDLKLDLLDDPYASGD